MYDLSLPSLPPGMKGLKGVLDIFKEQHTKSETSRQLCSFKKLFWKFPENFPKPFTTKHLLKTHSYGEYEHCYWYFSTNFPKVFRAAILKENFPMDVWYFIKEFLWMNASD